MKKVVQHILVFILAAQAVSLYALGSKDLFDDGKRLFEMGKYSESEEIFSRFISAWPDHEMVKEARLMRLTAKARTIAELSSLKINELKDSLARELNSLKAEFTQEQLREANLAVQYASLNGKPFPWDDLKKSSNSDLVSILKHKWHPEPFIAPIKTLDFINFRATNFKNDSDPELTGLMNYMKARALWQLMLSPLSLEANARILKTWGDWPVHKSLDQALRIGFNLGSPEIKKNVALLGFHYDCFRHKGLVKSSITSGLNSRWLTYLTERGINLQEAWCPR